jgi:hypothetical protein
MWMKPVCTAVAILLGGVSLLMGGNALAQTRAEPVAAVADAHQDQNFARLRDSAKALSVALNRLGEQYRIDQSGVVRWADQQIAAARAAADAGNMPEARRKLEEVYITTRASIVSMMHSPAVLQQSAQDPARLAQSSRAWQQADLKTRIDSTRALAAALKRIADEKNDALASSTSALIEPLLEEAQALGLNDRLPQGRVLADQAYGRVKAQIVRLRAGETLVRSLHFANKRDEYRYELERFDAHRMMIGLLVPAELTSDAALNMHLVPHPA